MFWQKYIYLNFVRIFVSSIIGIHNSSFQTLEISKIEWQKFGAITQSEYFGNGWSLSEIYSR